MTLTKQDVSPPEASETRQDLHRQLPSLRAYFSLRADADDIDDLLQDVALRLQSCTWSDPLENGRAYLYRIARSVVIDQRRRRQARQRHRHDSWGERHEPVEERCPERVLEAKQELSRAMKVLDELPERTTMVFRLHRFDHVSCAAIAAHMDISVSAVEKHIMRATRHMASALAA